MADRSCHFEFSLTGEQRPNYKSYHGRCYDSVLAADCKAEVNIDERGSRDYLLIQTR